MTDRLYPREKYLNRIRDTYEDTSIVKILTGVRGCGKTSLFELIVRELRDSSVEESSIISIAFDKRPYKGIKTSSQLIEIIKGRLNQSDDITYVFLDEVGNIDQYETALNVLSADNNISFFISSSSDFICKNKHLSALMLNCAHFEIFTLTYDEYIDMKMFYNHPIAGNRDEEFTRFLQEGAFPYTVRHNIHDSTYKYTKSLHPEIIKNDIRHNKRIKNKDIYDAIKSYVVKHYGLKISISDMQIGLAEKLHRPIRKETLYNYLSILEDTKIVYKCPRYDMNGKKILKGAYVYYLSDMSMYFADDMYNTLNYELAIKNALYNYLRSCDYAIACKKDDSECFIIEDPAMNYRYVKITDHIDGGDGTDNDRALAEEKLYNDLERIKDAYPKYILSRDSIMHNRNGVIHKNIIDVIESGIML